MDILFIGTDNGRVLTFVIENDQFQNDTEIKKKLIDWIFSFLFKFCKNSLSNGGGETNNNKYQSWHLHAKSNLSHTSRNLSFNLWT